MLLGLTLYLIINQNDGAFLVTFDLNPTSLSPVIFFLTYKNIQAEIEKSAFRPKIVI